MVGITRRYECDLCFADANQEEIIPVIKSVYPALSIPIQDYHADADDLRQITPGRVRCTINNVTGEFHRELLTVRGVTSFD